MTPWGPEGGEKTPSANAHEAGAHEVERARRAALAARDPDNGGWGPVGDAPRGLEHGRGGGLGWSLMRYFLGAAGSEGGLASGGLQAGGGTPPVPSARGTQAGCPAYGCAGGAAVDAAGVARRTHEAQGVTARAEVESETKSCQAIWPGGWTKASKSRTL